jgi:hypothetical protein
MQNENGSDKRCPHMPSMLQETNAFNLWSGAPNIKIVVCQAVLVINSRGIWPDIANEQMRRSQDPPPMLVCKVCRHGSLGV